MPDFDGVNLIITLDSGVTEVDVINDLYEPWKDWMLASPVNRGFPQAFVSDGGNPLTTVLNQGSYIFLQNGNGWRIRGPEENITIYFTGNLAVEEIALPTFIPTIGAFTVGIVGLQPITQVVTTGSGVLPSDIIAITAAVMAAMTNEYGTDFDDQIAEVWRIMGLDISNPMTVTTAARIAGLISQTITGDGETTSTVTRDP